MMEYPAMIYKQGRNRTFVANCMVKNLVGFGQTELEAIENLKKSLCSNAQVCEINIKPIYGLKMV